MQNEDEIINIIQRPANKKRPGRPKKKIIATPVTVHGIVGKPQFADDVLELTYSNPTMFKKLLQLFKAFDVSEVEMVFDAVGVKIITKDHYNKSTIYTIVDGRCMDLYYCKEPIKICVKRDNLECVLGTINKNHHLISFILKEDYRRTMYIIIKDNEYNNDNSYEVDVVFKPEDSITEPQNNEENYPIKFDISSKHFKTTINNIRKLSETFSIQKCGNEPLQFTFDKAQKVNWTGIYNDASKINLQSSIADDDIFIVSVCIDHIKPFSNSNIGEEIRISADKKEKMCFMTGLDRKDVGWTTIVKIFTEIKSYKNSSAEMEFADDNSSYIHLNE